MQQRWNYGLRRMFFWIAFAAVLLAGVARVSEFELSDWDEAPEPGFFVIAVRVDEWNSLPLLESLRTQMLETVPDATIGGESVGLSGAVVGGSLRVIRHSSRNIDLAALANECQSRVDDVMDQNGWTSKITLCIVDSQGNRFTATDRFTRTDQGDQTNAVEPRNQGEEDSQSVPSAR
ncbi:MAG: hypothetical protein QGG71_10485 [Pirellulaceae bacterium]|jgi:hypothetical protein|nr:hypothetical protein [Pirellulaceae bacterium]